MSRPRNPNPPIRISHVKQQKYGGTWYVMERAVRYCHETKQTKYLYSHAVGVLVNKDDDINKMIPIDEWNEKQEQKKQEEKIENIKNEEEQKIVTPTIHDTRDLNKIVYKPQQLFVLLMAAFGAGHTNCHGASVFVNAHNNDILEFFEDFKGLELSHDSVWRFFYLLSKDINEGLLQEFNQLLIDDSQEGDKANTTRRVLAADGQAVRATRIEAGKPRPKYVLSVYDSGSELILAQNIVGDKTNEITHIEGVLQKVDIRGAIVTADALHANVRFIKAVLNGGGHYLINIKNNNRVSKEWIEGLFKTKELEAMQLADDTQDFGHGRIENRSIRVLPGSLLSPELKEKWKCSGDGTVAELTSVRYDKTNDTTSTEVSYLVSSLPYSENDIAKTLLSVNRSRWGIESTHWLLDVVYSQDRTQCKSGEFLKGKTLFMKMVLNFARIGKKREEKRLGKKISHESFKAVFSNIKEFFRLYMDIVKYPQVGEA
ncbi:MAG: ISAs1 family transposase [Desulfovibrionaceae bacterium]|nr:ISAs1 family transposase [Desulfovibrionaceae bacterium]